MKYADLSEKEKIPLRVQAAKDIAMCKLLDGEDLTENLKYCIEHEQYCGAEGIKQAIEEFKNIETL